jgi:hypothetical protein
MWVTILGIFHLFHAPILIVFPLITNEYDKEYLIYFFSIMLSYTFLNGECPISYMAKKIVDHNYVAGDNYTYPEMRLFFVDRTIPYYFGFQTILYMGSVTWVMCKTNPVYLSQFAVLFVYFLKTRILLVEDKEKQLFQEITKCTLLMSISFLME